MTGKGAIQRRDWAAAGALAAALATIEWSAGRPPVCPCGYVALWAGTVNGPQNSQQLADWYSLSHVVHGFLFYAALRFTAPRLRVGTRMIVATTIEAGWELIENSPAVIARYRAATAAFGYWGDSVLNSAADVGWMTLGFALAARLPVRGSVAVVLALEAISLTAIRDDLFLNVLMLVHPIASVRVWQAG